MRILLIDDDRELGEVLRPHIEALGAELIHSKDGKTGLEVALKEEFSLAVIDVNLPGLGGFEICKKIREQKPAVPLIMLTAQDSEADKVLGLERGADDYVTKPFALREFLARISSALRRNQLFSQMLSAHNGVEVIHVGTLAVDIASRTASIAGQSVALTASEFDILAILCSRLGFAWNRADLAEQLWETLPDGYEHAITSHMSRLRQKLERHPGGRGIIETVAGFGYRVGRAKE